jgi:hypothetical protein
MSSAQLSRCQWSVGTRNDLTSHSELGIYSIVGYRERTYRQGPRAPGHHCSTRQVVTVLEKESHPHLHHALAGFAVDAAKRRRVGVSDDVSKYRMVEDI